MIANSFGVDLTISGWSLCSARTVMVANGKAAEEY